MCSDVPQHPSLTGGDRPNLLRTGILVRLCLRTTICPFFLCEHLEKCITTSTGDTVFLNEHQYGTLVSWAFIAAAVGPGELWLMSMLDEGGDTNTVAADELPKWNTNGGIIINGLTLRHEEEVGLFKTPSDVGALPAQCFQMRPVSSGR